MDFEGNDRLRLAYDFIQYTGRNIFLTGKAGTGKTTFLKFLRENSPKRMVVVAPTGVAAINAGGMTIHSFFQLSLGPQLPEEVASRQKSANDRFRFRKSKIDIIKSLDLLIIDEISMVRADLLDGVDQVLRRYRNNNQPFGGVQLLMIGDLQQLTPVAKEEEWSLLKNYYETPYFFSSRALLKSDYVTIELQHVYRQKDKKFIDLLNKIRDNRVDVSLLEEINKRYQPGVDIEKEGYIILTTHNYKANNINEKRLRQLSGEPQVYKSIITGNFPEYNYPTDEELTLKEGAQVMFVKNDPSPEKRFYNGKIGRVVELNKKQVKVLCEGEEEPVLVEPLVWEKTKYELDTKTKEIKEEIEGTFTQIPLKLAWAITIHKSQGLTFDKVVIDANEAFAHGQVYVALSRCRSLEGIILKSPVSQTAIRHDMVVKDFSERFEKEQPDKKVLQQSKKEYEKTLLQDLFRFEKLQKQLFYLLKLFNEHESVLISSPVKELEEINRTVKKDIVDVSEKFDKHLNFMASEAVDIEKDEVIQERIKKAAEYFLQKLKAHLSSAIHRLSWETDNTELDKKLEEAVAGLLKEISLKEKSLKAVENGFEVSSYLKARALAVLEEPPKKKSKKQVVHADVPHPELYSRLRDWRNVTAKEEGKLVYMVLPLNTMVELCKKLPGNENALKAVKGFGKKKVEQYGEEILSIISDYCDEYGFKPEFYESKTKEKKPDTKAETLALFQQGLSLDEIAQKRNLTPGTIAGHIAHLIAEGEVDIFQLMNKEKVDEIAAYFLNSESKSLSEAKEHFGDAFSFEELRFVLNYLIGEGKVSR